MQTNYSAPESNTSSMHPLFSTRSVLAGLILSFFVLTGLVGLGFAVGGMSMDEGTTLGGIGAFSGIWLGISLFASLFIGSYFAARVSKFQSARVGSAQGLIIASLFLGFFIYQAGDAVGNLGSLAGNMIGGGTNMASSGIKKLVQNEDVQDSFNDVVYRSIGDLEGKKYEIKKVALNIGNKIMQGDHQGAVDYLSESTGISREEAKNKLSELQIQAEEAVGDAKNMAGSALKTTGMTLFLFVLFGALSSILGGALGSRANYRRPIIP